MGRGGPNPAALLDHLFQHFFKQIQDETNVD
jgi:hypothetical protein